VGAGTEHFALRAWAVIGSRASNPGNKLDATTNSKESATNVACAAGNVIAPPVVVATAPHAERAALVPRGDARFVARAMAASAIGELRRMRATFS
jgi:hypothetical protein